MNKTGMGILVLSCCLALIQPVSGAQAPDLSKLDIVLRAVPDGPVANVRGALIPASDFTDLYKMRVAQAEQATGKKLPDIARIDICMLCMRLLVERQVLLQEAAKLGLDKIPDADLQKAWENEVKGMQIALSEGAKTPLTEAQVLAKAGTTVEEGKKELREAMAIDKMRETILKKKNVTVSDAEIEAEFNKNKKQFARPEGVHVSQILIAFPTKNGIPDPSGDAKAKARAEEALGKLVEGQNFATVAKAMSDGFAKEKGGDPGGPLPLDAFPDSIRSGIMALEINKASGIMKSDIGYHIMLLKEKIQGQEAVLDDRLKSYIRSRLLAPKSNVAIQSFCSEVTNGQEAISLYLDLGKQIYANPELRKLYEEKLKEVEADNRPAKPAAPQTTKDKPKEKKTN